MFSRVLRLAVIIAALSLPSCNKPDEANTNDGRTATKPAARILSSSRNGEFDRIARDLTGWDEDLSFTDQPNFGSYGQNTDDDIDFIGHVSAKIFRLPWIVRSTVQMPTAISVIMATTCVNGWEKP